MKKKESIEQCFAKLEQIVGELEAGEVDLENSIQLYKECISISNDLKKKLSVLREDMKVVSSSAL